MGLSKYAHLLWFLFALLGFTLAFWKSENDNLHKIRKLEQEKAQLLQLLLAFLNHDLNLLESH